MVRLQVIQGDAATDAELAAAEASRPKTRGDCVDGPRPCPRVGCRYHLLLDVQGKGHLAINGLKSNATDDEIVDRLLEMEHTCALDVADDTAGVVLERTRVGELLSLSRERIRQIERKEAGAALVDGFEPWFGERRQIKRNQTGDLPKRGKQPSKRFFYPVGVRETAVAYYESTNDINRALDIVEGACQRRPAKNLFYQWVVRVREAKMQAKNPTVQHFATDQLLERAWNLRKQGLTYGQIAEEVEKEYGRKPYIGTISNWMKRCKELFGDNT